MNEIMSWEFLGTTAGVATAVSVLTQILKHYATKADPKWIALTLALVITYCVQVISGSYAPETFIMSALNALISAGAAIGLYEGVIKQFTSKGD